MKLRLLILFILSCILLISLSFTVLASDEIIAKYGSRGKIVQQIQTYLYTLEYIKKTQIDGCYGKITREAVKSFQLEHCIEVTGIVDIQTYELLDLSTRDEFFDHIVIEGDTLFSIAQKYNLSLSALMVFNKFNEDSNIEMGQIIKIPTNILYLNKFVNRGRIVSTPAIPWSIVNKLWKVGEVAMITDYETQKSFYVKRLGGNLHCDVESLTKNDTKILYSLNGKWTWNRRAVIVTIHGQRIAASINCFAHGPQNINNNGLQGHICTHFIGSRIHKNQNIDDEHLKAIEEVEIDAQEILKEDTKNDN